MDPQIQKLRESGIAKVTKQKTEILKTISEIEEWRQDLTEQTIDSEYLQTEKQLAKVESKRNKILKTLTGKISNEQNLIFRTTKCKYTADIPDFLSQFKNPNRSDGSKNSATKKPSCGCQ